MLQKALMLLLIFTGAIACVSCGKAGNHYIYAAIPATSQLAVFREDPYSGVLTQLSESPYPVGSGAQTVVLHPSGKYLYVANPGQGENDISLFDINSDGTVNEITPRTPAGGNLPFQLAMDPGGSYLYVANVLSNNISVFSITASTGALAQVGVALPINLSPNNMQISPSGNFLYVSGPGQPGKIEVFSLSAGVLTQIGVTPTADNTPAGLAIDPGGSYLYAANPSANSISIYCIVPAPCTSGAVGPSGTLQQVPQSPLADADQHPVALILNSTGSYLFVANQGSNNVSTYSITSGTGFPVAVTDSPFATEAQPSFLAIDPNGKYLYVGNQSGGAGIEAFGVADGSLNTIATYAVGNSPTSIAVLQ
ncbi:MAG: beta-propeller fold lactonase family protein [Candidatus Sulfotelmatobacter sp.]